MLPFGLTRFQNLIVIIELFSKKILQFLPFFYIVSLQQL